MEHSPFREANSRSASQEFSWMLWNLKVHYRVHENPPLILILNCMISVYIPTLYFLKIRLNTMFLSAR